MKDQQRHSPDRIRAIQGGGQVPLIVTFKAVTHDVGRRFIRGRPQRKEQCLELTAAAIESLSPAVPLPKPQSLTRSVLT
jgi:hypothetical protein